MFTGPCASLDYIPKIKSRQKSKSPTKRNGVKYKFCRANPDLDKFYVGDIWFGKTNNILPDKWLSGDAELNSNDDNEKLILYFNSTVVVITITTDVQFLKDLLYTRLFNIDLKLDDENIIASLYLKEIPLPKFSNKIGSVLKTVFSLTHNICCEYNEINTIKSSCTVEHFDDLYRNVATLRGNVPDKVINHDQLKPILPPYQQCAIRWMLHKENLARDHKLLHPLYQKVVLRDGTDIYFDKYTGYIESVPPEVDYFQSGGILADEMGLGKTVEVLALTLLHKRPLKEDPIYSNNTPLPQNDSNSTLDNLDEINSSDDTCNELESPTVQMLSRKRKIRINGSDTKGAYVIKEKKIKKQSNAKKSTLRLALESWYHSMLEKTAKKIEPHIQCICGEITENGTVECSECGRTQHAECLGYQKRFGSYMCPQCWMKQPLLESKATLIVTPLALKQQWCDEICKHIAGKFKVLQYGSGHTVKCTYPKELQEYDIVITTYSTLQSELRLSENGQSLSLRRPSKYSLPGSPITLINWWRLCLDEAQTVETPWNMVSIMAKKLNAEYRWAVTGTPISKDISDLYGLISYLQITPYCELETWENILYKPYINGRKTNMHRFLAEVLWRTSKNDILDQINIPAQTVKEHWVEFTAVEKFFYDREHELSSQEFLNKLRNMDLTLPLKLVNKSVLRKIMIPLLALRQACVHHQTVKGRYLATRKQVSSMEDLLDALVAKSLAQCEESLRSIVSAMNGLASIFILQDNPKMAAVTYRRVLALSQQYSEQEKEIALEVDKLQLIHVMYNLMEILELHETIPRTLEDDSLREKWDKLEKEYLDKFMKPVVTTLNDNTSLGEQICELQRKFVLPPGQWFADALDWITINQLFSEYFKKLEALCWNAHFTIGFNCTSERAVMFKISTWDEKLTEVKMNTVSFIEELLVLDESQNSYSVPVEIIRQASECHLRPDKKTKSKKGKGTSKECPICTANFHLKEYESLLFSSEQQTDDKANTGSWKPAAEEAMLRALLSIGKTHKADKDLLHDGAVHLEILELLRKEFKEIRKLWTLIDALVCAKDELDMCKIRLQIKKSNVEEGSLPKNRLLKALDYEIKNKCDDIYYLDAAEIPYQLAHLSSQERCATKMLEENMGTYKYLQTLHKQQTKGEDPDPCPICKCILNKQWNIMTCGHCYCIECMQVLIGQQSGFRKRQYVTCAICRKTIRVSDISYIHKEQKETKTEGLLIKGNCSSKVEAVIKLIIELKKDDENVKVLVFSNWVVLLKLMQTIFALNGISSEVLLPHHFDKSLDSFKDVKKGITALLLPVHSGGKGLNLIEATHIVFVEPLLNPGDELQAIGRIHRIGQTKPTIIHKFFIKNTIEESIYHTMSINTEEWDANRVTLGHFKQLFDYTHFNGNDDNIQSHNAENLSLSGGSTASVADQTSSSDIAVNEVSMFGTTNIELSSTSNASTSAEESETIALHSEMDVMEEAEVITIDINRLAKSHTIKSIEAKLTSIDNFDMEANTEFTSIDSLETVQNSISNTENSAILTDIDTVSTNGITSLCNKSRVMEDCKRDNLQSEEDHNTATFILPTAS